MPPGLIAGRVLDDGGNPIAGARVFFADGPSHFPDIAALTDDNGSFLLSAPVPGEWILRCVADGFAVRDVRATVGTGEETALTVVLPSAPAPG
jgi:hypothetical protein